MSRNTRTISGYVESLLEYPRWVIERDVDFSNCQYQGTFTASAKQCESCQFGDACRWLNLAELPATPDSPLAELLNALTAAAHYLQVTYSVSHERCCNCETCSWLRKVRRFLHTQRH
jgi:hypothetical protein